MSASSARTGAAAAVLLVMLPLAHALAEGAPTSLLPEAPVTASPVVTPREAFPEVTNPRAEKVQVQELGVIDSNATGILDEAHGGLGSEMWAGTNMAVVQKVLPGLPAQTTSHAMRSLMRRLLLTTAAIPPGSKLAAGDSLIKLRADKLWAMGELDGLNALLKGVPSSAVTPELRRLAVDTALLAGDTATACNETVALRAQAPADPFAAKLQVFCQLTAGKTNEASFGEDVLREQKINDPAFFAAADALAGIGSGKLGDAFAAPTPLTLAMARAAKLPIPEAAAATPQPALLRAIATTPTASLEARLLAGEKAEALGAVDTDVLRQIYESVTFTPQELAAPVADKTTRGRALLYRASLQQTLPTAKAEIIGKALTTATASGSDAYFTAARIYAPQIAGLKPAPELVSFAVPAARALIAAGQAEAAKPWISFARAQGLGNTDIANAAASLAPLLRLLGPDDDRPMPPGALAVWRKARPDLSPDAQIRRGAVCLSLLSAFGEKIPSEEWLPLYDGPLLVTSLHPRPALWNGLRVATEDLRLGETVLLSLASLGEPGLTQSDPSDLYRVVSGLRLLGLDADARALAVEAAIANGV
ncbi:MAG TPA: antifreeze protein [Patescibacteria group bacterium]|nr:antifreeze protein [Patescibacteria group bacterium]